MPSRRHPTAQDAAGRVHAPPAAAAIAATQRTPGDAAAVLVFACVRTRGRQHYPLCKLRHHLLHQPGQYYGESQLRQHVRWLLPQPAAVAAAVAAAAQHPAPATPAAHAATTLLATDTAEPRSAATAHAWHPRGGIGGGGFSGRRDGMRPA